MKIDCVSVNDKNGLNRVYMLLNSLKRTKQSDTTIHYRLVLEEVNDQVKQYFSDLQSQDFKIEYISTSWFKQRINPPYRNYFYYVRCLFPNYFKQLDRVLYLDTDIVFLQNGVEQLWQSDLQNKSLGAISDIVVNQFPGLKYQKAQTKTANYFNSGVLIMDLKRIRQTKKNEQLARWVFNWDASKLGVDTMDQTLLNYIFRQDDVKYLDYRFNDFSLVLTNTVYKCVKEYLKTKGYQQPVNSIKDAVIVHFLGSAKPWAKDFARLKNRLPYGPALEKIWETMEKHLGKKNEEAKEV